MRFFDFGAHPLLIRFIGIVLLPLLVIALTGNAYLRQSIPKENGAIILEGLNDTVEVDFDNFFIPHVRASSDRDAFFAIGYLHAQNRMWQMEYQRRFVSGRLSEIFGRRMLDNDKLMRTIGLHQAAKSDVAELSEEARNTLEAYVAGVNAWIQSAPVLPLEFLLLGFEPEPWTMEDSLLQIKLMDYNMGMNFNEELTNQALVQELGAKRTEELRGNSSGDSEHIEMGGAVKVPSFIYTDLLAFTNRVNFQSMKGGDWIGSNAWAVSGRHTQSGRPLLASDPHLTTEIPSLWYLARIEGDELDVTGATMPGLPYVLMGRNKSIAWGVTNSTADVQDIFVERVELNDPNKYQIDGVWHEVESHEEDILIASDFPSFLNEEYAPVVWKVRSTLHGPLISDAIGSIDTPLSLRWTALDHGDRSFESFLAINYAEDFNSFRNALKSYVAPALNFIYADSAGNIAHQMAGRVPIRRNHKGLYPVPGWDSTYEWAGQVPFDELPHTFNPPAGFLVSANNKNHGEDYSFFISDSWAPDYRANRIKEMLGHVMNRDGGLTSDDMARVQSDTKSLQAVEVLPFLRALNAEGQVEQRALAVLKDWNGGMDVNRIAPTIYHTWLRYFNRAVISDELAGSGLSAFRQQRMQQLADQPRPEFLRNVITGKFSYWCDDIATATTESCEMAALTALGEALEELEAIAGADMDDWAWGDNHETQYQHAAFRATTLLNLLFNRSIPSGGDSYSINAAPPTFVKGENYWQLQGPSYRQIVDISDQNEGLFVINTGQSGNALSRHYDDMVVVHSNMKFASMNAGGSRDEGRILKLQPAREHE